MAMAVRLLFFTALQAFCDQEMKHTKATLSDRQDESKRKGAALELTTAQVAQLREELANLAQELSDLAESDQELTKMRQAEHEEHTQAYKDLELGLAGVQTAIKALRDYYSQDRPVQLDMAASMALAADGRAPKVDIAEVSTAGAGVISFLEVVESDFARNMADLQSQDRNAQEAYEKLMQQSKVVKAQKEADVKHKTTEATNLERSATELRSDTASAKQQLEAVTEYLGKLQEECTAKELKTQWLRFALVETREERMAKRQKEMEGLQEALSILESAVEATKKVGNVGAGWDDWRTDWGENWKASTWSKDTKQEANGKLANGSNGNRGSNGSHAQTAAERFAVLAPSSEKPRRNEWIESRSRQWQATSNSEGKSDPSAGKAPPPMPGNPQDVVNRVAVILTVSLIVVVVAALCYDRRRDMTEIKRRRPATWVLALMVCSYLLLIPALFATLFNMKIGAVDALVLEEASDSTIEFIHLLGDTGSWLGAVLVAIFAILVPLVKIVLLVLGEFWRCSNDRRRIQAARVCIRFVQIISKWACPDIIAYIFLFYLVRHLNRPPINGLFSLDVGFTCFTLFCWGSTISSLGVHLPALDEDMKAASKEPWPLRVLGRKGTAVTMFVIQMVFVVCFVLGMSWSCLGLRLDQNILANNGLPQWQIDVMVNLRVAEHAKADVTIFQCIDKLLKTQAEISYFQTTSFAFDMLVLSVTSLQILSSPENSEDNRCNLITLTKHLKKLAMLDVLILGIVVVVLSGSVYRKQGGEGKIGELVSIRIKKMITVVVYSFFSYSYSYSYSYPYFYSYAYAYAYSYSYSYYSYAYAYSYSYLPLRMALRRHCDCDCDCDCNCDCDCDC
eukprot:s1105_g1.t1